MRRTLLAAAGLALLIPAAVAQTAPASTSPLPAAQPGGPVGAGGPALPAPPPPGSPRGPGLLPPPPPPSRAAHVRLERGDTRIDLACAETDTTKACADVATGLIDRLAAMPAQNRP